MEKIIQPSELAGTTPKPRIMFPVENGRPVRQTTGNLRPGNQRVMIYCHDSMGVGHLRRSLAIASHVKDRFPRASLLLVTGTPHVPLFELSSGVDYLKLPALAKCMDGSYHSKFLGLRMRQLVECRRALLLATLQHFRPAVMLVDKAPAGVCGELVPALRWIQRNAPEMRVVFGMRDIEDHPEATRRKWSEDGVLGVLEECFDEIWVYGMQGIVDVVQEYCLSAHICAKLRYVGYIERPSCDHESTGESHEKTVLVTVGGGTDGEQVLGDYFRSAVARVASAGARSIVVGGPDLPPRAASRFRTLAVSSPKTTWVDYTPCMNCLVRQADLVVCMGGYNTLCEVVASRKPALVIPRVHPRQEQAIRARRWEQLGLVRVMDPLTATANQLGRRVLELLDKPFIPDRTRLDMEGLVRIERRFAAFWPDAGRDGA